MLIEIDGIKEFCLRNCFECREFHKKNVEIKNERNAPGIGEVLRLWCDTLLSLQRQYYCPKYPPN